MPTNIQDITALLDRAASDRQAREDLFRVIERRFRDIAGALLRKEQPGHSWQETMLVDDAFWRLIDAGAGGWENREQFFCSAAKVMRRLLVDHARQRKSQKRGGSAVVLPLDERQETPRARSNRPRDIVELNDLLERLEAVHPDEFKVFDLLISWAASSARSPTTSSASPTPPSNAAGATPSGFCSGNWARDSHSFPGQE